MANQDRQSNSAAPEICPFRLLLIGVEQDFHRELGDSLALLGRRAILVGAVNDPAAAVEHCRHQRIDLICIGARDPAPETTVRACRAVQYLHHPPMIALIGHRDAPSTSQSIATLGIDALLIRPINTTILASMLERLPAHDQQAPSQRRPHLPRAETMIRARYRGHIHSVALDDVIYLMAGHKYVTVRHLGGELLIEQSLCSFERRHGTLFLRIHRNALVSMRRFHSLEKSSDGSVHACLHDCAERPRISRRHLPQVRRWLHQQRSTNPG